MVIQIDYHTDEICKIIKGQWLLKEGPFETGYLSIDSRKYSEPDKTLFWALPGDGRDGSQFINELYARGVRNFVTAQAIKVKHLKGANVIQVSDSLGALQQLAAAHRKRFPGLYVIGITGSNGKTIVKDWMAEILSGYYKVIKSPRSYNSQIGVALSLLQIKQEHEIGVFEAGISRPDEMAPLAKMIDPHTGILTNIGTAHDEGFQNRVQKIKEKLLLFQNSKVLIYPGEDRLIADALRSSSFDKGLTKMSVGVEDHNTFHYSASKKKDGDSVIEVKFRQKNYSITIPFTDTASTENAVNAFCGILASGKYNEGIADDFRHLHRVSMRLELKPGKNHCSIINDSYSNDLQSLRVAVDFLKQQSHKKTTIILSDLLQTGIPGEELYSRVADILIQQKINRLLAVGPEISSFKNVFNKISERQFFSSTKDFLEALSQLHFYEEAILVKGARKFSFEKISGLLEAQLHQTVLSVNLSNLAHNIRIYKSLLKPGTKLMTMVKAFAYGSGIEQVGALLQHTKVDYLTVAYTDEGVALRESGINLPIMVLNIEPESFDNLVNYKLEPEIFSFETLSAFSSYLKQRKIKSFPVHIKIDTGMHRLGFSKTDIPSLLHELGTNRRIKVKSVFSHLSASDEPAHDDFTKGQFRLFNSIVAKIRAVITYPFDCHLANTSAISRFPAMQMDMVRLGIGMYGIDSNPLIADKLKVVNRLTTTVSQIKKVKAGEVVGYGVKRVTEDKTIATIRIGYADGYSRALGNGKGRMMLHGKPASTTGNICMDMTMLDVSKIPNVKEGDEVLVFGEDLPVEKVAKWAGTIPYEIFTGISPRVRRVYFEE